MQSFELYCELEAFTDCSWSLLLIWNPYNCSMSSLSLARGKDKNLCISEFSSLKPVWIRYFDRPSMGVGMMWIKEDWSFGFRIKKFYHTSSGPCSPPGWLAAYRVTHSWGHFTKRLFHWIKRFSINQKWKTKKQSKNNFSADLCGKRLFEDLWRWVFGNPATWGHDIFIDIFRLKLHQWPDASAE